MPRADLMPDVLWDQVRDWFAPDGSLLDAYVFDTTVADWQAFVDLIRPQGWWYDYLVDRRSTRLPHHVDDIPEIRSERGVLLQVRPVPGMLINVHFFTSEEIEVDFAPEELQGQARLDALCGFLRAVGRHLRKPMVLTPENAPHDPLIGYDVSTDRVVALASHDGAQS